MSETENFARARKSTLCVGLNGRAKRMNGSNEIENPSPVAQVINVRLSWSQNERWRRVMSSSVRFVDDPANVGNKGGRHGKSRPVVSIRVKKPPEGTSYKIQNLEERIESDAIITRVGCGKAEGCARWQKALSTDRIRCAIKPAKSAEPATFVAFVGKTE